MKHAKKLIAAAAALVLAAACAGSAFAAENADVTRLNGKDRYETAAAISAEGWKKADTVVIVSANSYADALAGTPLAYAYDAPILLANKTEATKATVDEVTRLGAQKAIIIGGQSAVSEAVAIALENGCGCETVRISGSTRYETAVEIAKALNEKTGVSGDVFFASANNYPDALAISSIASLKAAPILYIDKTGKLNDKTAEYLKSLNGASVTILGGNGAIGAAADSNIEKIAGEFVQRISGSDRYETNLKINENYGKTSILKNDALFVATGKNFPDALAGGVLAAKNNAAMLLVDGTVPDLTKNQFAYVKELNASKTYILGGTGAVCEGIEKLLGGDTPAPVTPVDVSKFVGEWHDEVAGRAAMTVTLVEGKPYFEVNWPNSAFDTYMYTFLCTPDADKLTYDAGFKGVVTTDEAGEATRKILDEEATGTVELTADGAIIWTEADAKDNPHKFVRDDNAPATFKTGTWASTFGINYVFYADGKSGRNINVADGMGIGFNYELNKDGKCVFHMGGADVNTYASVEFIYDSVAAITWEDGSRIVLYYVCEDTSEEFADNYVIGQITGEDEDIAFKTGTWASASGINFVFYDDGKSGYTVNPTFGLATPFEYELGTDGKCVFHMGSVDDNTEATVQFVGGGDDIAAITWKEDGSKTVIYFVKADTSDEFAYTYIFGQVTGEDE